MPGGRSTQEVPPPAQDVPPAESAPDAAVAEGVAVAAAEPGTTAPVTAVPASADRSGSGRVPALDGHAEAGRVPPAPSIPARVAPPPLAEGETIDDAVDEPAEGPGDDDAAPVVPPPPIDPGASALARQLVAALDAVDPGATVSVTVGPLRNRSRRPTAELRGFETWFAAALAAPVRREAGERVRLAAGAADDPASWRLVGSAYLATMDGIDQWELYLELVEPASRRVAWRNASPLRIARTPMPGRPAFLRWPGDRAP